MLEPEVMRRYGREDSGVKVPGSDKYIGTLNVFHELHCIKRLYSYSYPEVYWADLTEKQREINRIHNDFLRQAAMCHGDIGIVTYQWSEESLMPVTNQTTHQCINWDRLDKWSKERSVDMMKPGWLVHPTKDM
ncbi:Tat pathway signal sequence protein [Rutstroemia sp. NJR-2017a BBW]|nr:Tat pathway signal sequence protein [Rutstroemia sp. NJR-2017a BBW]